MSTRDVELIHVRLKEELARLALKPAAAAKAAGEPDSQGLRDVIGNRKRLTAELLAALVAQGVDALYVLTGERAGPPPEVFTADERELLALFRASTLTGKAAAIGALQGAASSTAGRSQTINAPVFGGVAGNNIVHKGDRKK